MNWDSIKSILKLSIPLIISQLGLFFVQLSDTVMVGQIGSRDLAAISFGGNVYFFIYIFGIGIVSVGVIHDGVSTTIHREVLQSATLWVVGVGLLRTVAILQRSKMCIFFDFSCWFYRRFISLSWWYIHMFLFWGLIKERRLLKFIA